MARPSNFSSQTYGPTGASRREAARVAQARNSSTSKALSSDIIATSWATGANSSDGAAPTVRVGESAAASSGWRSSSSLNSATRAS